MTHIAERAPHYCGGIPPLQPTPKFSAPGGVIFTPDALVSTKNDNCMEFTFIPKPMQLTPDQKRLNDLEWLVEDLEREASERADEVDRLLEELSQAYAVGREGGLIDGFRSGRYWGGRDEREAYDDGYDAGWSDALYL